MKKFNLLSKLIAAIIVGIVIGMIAPVEIIKLLATFNSIFGNFLSFCIPFIIIGFVAPGIGDLGNNAGKILALTAGIAYISTIASGSFAFFINNTIFPIFLNAENAYINAANPENTLVKEIFTIEMPPIMSVMSSLLTAFILGLGTASLKTDNIKHILRELQEIVSKLISVIIIPLLPIHVLGIFSNMSFSGTVFQILNIFIKVFGIIIILHISILIIQYTIASYFSKQNPFKLLKNMIPAYFTAIGTQSSAATIPVTLSQTKKNNVNNDVADFVIPLCATIHLSGSTITLISCSMAIMMINNINIDFYTIFPFIMMLGITMIAAPGIPGGAVIAAIGLLEIMLNFNPEQLSLMMALYIAQDSFGTACNVTGDGAIAVLVNSILNKKHQH